MFQDCQPPTDGEPPEALPFVSFFSGHVATMVVVGNHMALRKSTFSWAVIIHILNGLQIIRLLATRGHYSIDMIIGWYVAVYVTNPAGRLGRYYSKGATIQDILPKTPREAFEKATGVEDTRNYHRMSMLMNRPEVQEVLKNLPEGDDSIEIHSDTTARILQETATKMMQEQREALQEEMKHLQQQARQAMETLREQHLQAPATTEAAKKDQ